jgi:hypothetical protein
MNMEIMEEVPGALKKAATWLKWASLEPLDPVERGMWEGMQCLVHANGDKSFVLAGMPESASSDFYQNWKICVEVLKRMGKQVSRSEPRFHETYGLIEAEKDNLRIEVYRDSKIAVWSRHKRGWGISDDSITNIKMVMGFWKTWRQLVPVPEGPVPNGCL